MPPVRMLLAVSRTLQAFLHAVVPPPLAHTELEQWVRLADLSSEAASEHANRLVVNLYAVEPDAFLRNGSATHEGGVSREAPLPLGLHFLITYYGERHDEVQRVLGHVLQAFHSSPLIVVRQYLDAADIAALGGAQVLPERVRVRLEVPEGDKVSHLWNAMRQGRRLALYYRADVALVPGQLPTVHRPVAAGRPPRVGRKTS